MTTHSEAQVRRSALWAAYGDAVGFPTELVSESQFRRRTGQASIQRTIAWKRRVGGMFGPEVQFPTGAYSDDTQLRLCTSRAIRGDGFFDVESFAKIELPIWLNYALGAGRGSKLAAANLALRDSTWFQNFYNTSQAVYWQGGGNGAAMRVQPHVWAASELSSTKFISNVVRDAVCTHGHPRAIAGAAIHALILAYVFDSASIPSPSQWLHFAEACDFAFACLTEEDELALFWSPNWERLTGQPLAEAFAQVKHEWQECAEVAAKLCDSPRANEETYTSLLNLLGGYSSAERGSGLKTPLFALVLAWLKQDRRPQQAILTAANAFGSDTDTIGTMVGALLGAIADDEPDEEIQDADYISAEASRLFHISQGRREKSFEYPDPLRWAAPKAQRDALLVTEDGPFLAGLGPVDPFGEVYVSEKGTEMEWQWCRTVFGQTILTKRKPGILTLGGSSEGRMRHVVRRIELPQLDSLFPDPELSIDAITQECIRSSFDPTVVGEALLRLSSGSDGVERAIAFAAIIAKARIARTR
ncbi:ADP-ribosylglycohydrolase family protein [Ralstonia sp. UBA689]|uniref:ADP-ribosylglycohydrolase family protein n=1 Tax=Ralstonia sp. UBA689 TaxID=1947373 RepID=UPI0025D20A07|nr:ADP-ribosylglycohydrolase family protein [Ralstonia sp. UBA689]